MVYGTAPALREKLKAGEKPDVLISLAAEIDEMAKHNTFSITEPSVASIKLGLAVRNGAAPPDIKTLDSFKQTLVRADSIIHNSLASGLSFAKQLERIGIAEQVKSKIIVIKGNTQLVELARRTGNDVAAGQLTQLIASKDVQFVGALPSEAQTETVYSAGALVTSKSPDVARSFVQFLASSKAAAIFSSVGANSAKFAIGNRVILGAQQFSVSERKRTSASGACTTRMQGRVEPVGGNWSVVTGAQCTNLPVTGES